MWIKTTAQFRSKALSNVEWDLLDDSEQQDNCDSREFRFDTKELSAYNQAHGVCTTLRFKNGDDFTINMTVKQLDEVIFNNNS